MSRRPGLQDAAGHNIGVDGEKFARSIHGSLKCNDCHADIKEYPHPDKIAKVECETCHAGQATELAGSVHSDGGASLHQLPRRCARHLPKDDPRSAVYPLNVPKTCGACHGNNGMAQKHGLASVYPSYMDSIHGFALSKEGLLVAANCQSCHGSHHILSRKDPQSPTFKANIPKTCGNMPRGNQRRLLRAACTARRLRRAKWTRRSAPTATPRTPSCSRRRPASACSRRPSAAPATRTSSPPIATHSTRNSARWADTWKRRAAGTATKRTRCCRRPIRIRRCNEANLVTTCGKCHAGANLSFVQYQPHANARDRKLNPALYFVRLFMNLLLISVLTFFVIHTILWLIRSRYNQVKRRAAEGGKNA